MIETLRILAQRGRLLEQELKHYTQTSSTGAEIIAVPMPEPTRRAHQRNVCLKSYTIICDLCGKENHSNAIRARNLGIARIASQRLGKWPKNKHKINGDTRKTSIRLRRRMQ